MASRPTRLSITDKSLHVRCETFKVGYASYHEALDGAERAMEQDRVNPGCHLMPYYCERCGEWHTRNQKIVF